MLASALCLLWVSVALAAPRNPRFENLGTDEGLPVTAVEALLQDHDGFVWFGTQAGLVRYDGFRFVHYRNVPGDPRSLGSNLVTSLLEDRQGAIWVGTIGGLFRLNPERTAFEAFEPDEGPERGKGNRTIRQLLLSEADGRESIWIATADGLQRFDPETGIFRFWHKGSSGEGGLSSDDIRSLAMDASGRLWVGGSAGLDRLHHPEPGDAADNVQIRRYPLTGSARANVVMRLLVEDDQRLWIGSTEGLQLAELSDGELVRMLPLPQGIDFEDTVRVLFRERGGAIWIGTQNGGVYRVEDNDVRHYRHRAEDPHSLADDSVVSIIQDRNDSLWLGTWYNGLSRLDLGSGGFDRHTAVADERYRLSDSLVYNVAADAEGGIWFSLLRGGIDHVDASTGELRHFRHDPSRVEGLPSDLVRCAVPDGKGGLWVGTQQDGFGHFDPASGRFRVVQQSAGPQELRSIRAVAVAADGVVWLGSEGGLLRHDPADGSLQTYVHDPARADSLSQGRVLSLLLDRRGQVWVGTETGLDRLLDASGRFEHFQHDPTRPDSLSQSLVADIHEDAQGRIWVGTAAGLDLLQRRADGSAGFQTYTVKDGLADDAINSIENDASGRLWLSTDSGITRFDPANGEVRNYSARDGLPSGSFFVHSSARLPDGTLVFGGSHGAVSFQPAAIIENAVAPPVRITDLLVSGVPVVPGKPNSDVTLQQPIEFAPVLRLGPSVTDFTLEFAALHFADPTRNRFAYQLQGFDRDFIETEAAKPRAIYTNLDPGDYVFRVRAANKDGVWNEEGATLAITVLPPWWATWWFRALAVAAIVAVLAWAYRRRVAMHEANRLRLESSVRERTAELAEQTGRLERSLVQVERTHREVSLLGELSAALQGSQDIEVACERLAAFCPQMFPNSSGALYLQRPQPEPWMVASRWGRELPEHLDRADCRGIVEGRLLSHHAADGESLCGHLQRQSVPETASACIPLIAQDSTLGLLLILHDDGPEPAEARRRHAVAASMAEQTALALANLELRSALLEQSVRDPLTGLFNRRRLLESLREALSESCSTGEALALLMIDIDHFKAYNDTHGHAAGDRVLQSVAETLQACVRGGDVVCRYGGEELAVLLPGTVSSEAMRIAESMQTMIRETAVSHEGGRLPPVTLSMGLALFPDDGDGAEGLLKAADLALYEAKASGRDRIVRHIPRR
ncbi:MAG: diguanylate cyclase [Lysobacteraceae bacterium]